MSSTDVEMGESQVTDMKKSKTASIAERSVHAHLELHREGQRVYLPALLLT
jgi:hypothetical protein